MILLLLLLSCAGAGSEADAAETYGCLLGDEIEVCRARTPWSLIWCSTSDPASCGAVGWQEYEDGSQASCPGDGELRAWCW